MKKRYKLLLTVLLAVWSGTGAFAQSPAEEVVRFKFVPGRDMFYIPWGGNDTELNRLYALVDEYRTEITAGRMPVHVDGYCASLPSEKENLDTAFVRSSRVKSELITRKGLLEEHFVTHNHAAACDGHKDMVVVTLRIPAKAEPKPEPVQEAAPVQPRRPEPVKEEPKREQPPVVVEPQPEPVAEKQAEPQAVVPAPATPDKPWCFAVRTNLLYDAFLLPTLGAEWRVNQNIGVKLDGSLSYWGGAHGKVQKMWLVSPEVRWYLTSAKRLYVGAGGNYGEANIYKYPLGSTLNALYTGDTGYQGRLWSAGLTTGYQLPLSRTFSLDFNLGLGYTRAEYDSFTMKDGVRVFKAKSQSKGMWGPTQAGVSLVWIIR